MIYQRPLNTLRGLTLIEVLVVIAIIGILAAVISVNAVQSGKISRDAKRQADLRMLQSAVELYKNKNGRYPEGCNGADAWSGQANTKYACGDGSSQYINDLAPQFISVLPYDDKINGADSGYVYRTNGDGTVYKIMAMRTVESEAVDYYHEFKSCDIIPAPGPAGSAYTTTDIDVGGWCRYATKEALDPSVYDGQYSSLDHCLRTINNKGRSNRFETSYGVWGGFAAEAIGPEKYKIVRDTTRVICK